MNKTELIAAIAHNAGLTKKDTAAAVEAFQAVVMSELAAGGDVNIPGFGKFSAPLREERQGRNPSNGKSMTIPAARVPKFKAGATLKANVNG